MKATNEKPPRIILEERKSMLYSETDEGYINLALKEAEEMLHGEENNSPGYFSRDILTKVPNIAYPGLTQEECENVRRLLREVLYLSKMKNHYNEVAITFDLKRELKNKSDYVTVFGNSTSVPFYSDKKTAELLDNTKDLVIVSLHNHPNASDLSLKDITTFIAHSNIKLMCVVNKEGEVSFLSRQNTTNLLPCAAPLLEMFNGDEDGIYTMAHDILTKEERESLKTKIIDNLVKHGVEYQAFISKESRDYSHQQTEKDDV